MTNRSAEEIDQLIEDAEPFFTEVTRKLQTNAIVGMDTRIQPKEAKELAAMLDAMFTIMKHHREAKLDLQGARAFARLGLFVWAGLLGYWLVKLIL